MTDSNKSSSGDWPAILFILVAVPLAFTFGGIWIGIIVLVVGVVALGWNKRHQGPIPTNRPKE
jgi:hypothetical protein